MNVKHGWLQGMNVGRIGQFKIALMLIFNIILVINTMIRRSAGLLLVLPPGDNRSLTKNSLCQVSFLDGDFWYPTLSADRYSFYIHKSHDHHNDEGWAIDEGCSATYPQYLITGAAVHNFLFTSCCIYPNLLLPLSYHISPAILSYVFPLLSYHISPAILSYFPCFIIIFPVLSYHISPAILSHFPCYHITFPLVFYHISPAILSYFLSDFKFWCTTLFLWADAFLTKI